MLQALRAEMPQERFVYWADSDFAPYGERSEQFVIERSHFITQQLIAQGPMKALVVACNTATAVAIESLRATFPSLPFIGVEPALKPALAQTKTLRVGVMSTQGTLRSLRFEKLLQSVLNEASSQSCEFVLQSCKGLAIAIEQQTEKSLNDTQAIDALCAHYVASMGSFGLAPGQIDTLVLGCTHYVFVQDKRLIVPLPPNAENADMSNNIQLWTNGSLQALQAAASRWLDLSSEHCLLVQTQSSQGLN